MTIRNTRAADEPRPVKIEIDINPYAEGSCIISTGNTKVLCTATVNSDVPKWMAGQGRGWVTAEYGMLPRATHSRKSREAKSGKQDGRTVEIQRLIGRSLRSVVNLDALGERLVTLDCDVLQADGGTRTASITGSIVSLQIALMRMLKSGEISENPLQGRLAAISCGIDTAGNTLLDLDYQEDSSAVADANFVLTEEGHIIEVQVTGEANPITPKQFQEMFDFAQKGIHALIQAQKEALAHIS